MECFWAGQNYSVPREDDFVHVTGNRRYLNRTLCSSAAGSRPRIWARNEHSSCLRLGSQGAARWDCQILIILRTNISVISHLSHLSMTCIRVTETYNLHLLCCLCTLHRMSARKGRPGLPAQNSVSLLCVLDIILGRVLLKYTLRREFACK